jgi:hypothetical protein
MIATRAAVLRAEVHGLFDDSANVDVFLLHLATARATPPSARTDWATPRRGAHGPKVSDLFKIRVGPVVDFRDPHQGPWRPYVSARFLPMWQEVSAIGRKRRFNKRLFRPPFVVVRRTSRPGDPHRAVGTVIRGREPVAVDNHLIVLLPTDRTVARCTELLQVLRAPETDAWLDRRIRCRHLTVTALSALPWRMVR